jgi:hypothetical protein
MDRTTLRFVSKFPEYILLTWEHRRWAAHWQENVRLSVEIRCVSKSNLYVQFEIN